MTSRDAEDLLHAWAAERAGARQYGHLTGSCGGGSGLSRPEAAAHRLEEIAAADEIVRTMLSRRQMRLVVARYVRQIDSDRKIAVRLRMNRKYVGPATHDVRDLVHKMLPIVVDYRRSRHNILTVGSRASNLSLRLEKSH